MQFSKKPLGDVKLLATAVYGASDDTYSLKIYLVCLLGMY